MRLHSRSQSHYTSYVCSSHLIASFFFFFSSRRRHTRSDRDWSSDVCSSDLDAQIEMLKGLEMRFDKDGNHNYEFIVHPDTARRLRENPPTPEQMQRWEEAKIGRASCRERV